MAPAPVVSGRSPSNDITPEWMWVSGDGGNGTFRYQLDSESGEWTETVNTAYASGIEFNDGETYILYVQEQNATLNWSGSGSKAITIDTSVPTLDSSTLAENSYIYILFSEGVSVK